MNVQHSDVQPPSPYKETKGFFLAGFWLRVWAYLIDLIVIGSITRLIIKPVFKVLDITLVEGSMFAPISILSAIVFYGYFVLMTKFFSQTIGKMVLGIKVIDLKGGRPTWGTVIFRELIGRFISSTIFILYVVVAFTTKKQGIHDLFADTTVVQEKKKLEFAPAV
ncbi:RDD family protein [Bacillus sp. Marseille-Q1617]|uniref:RDD family protein n=1 Tax=Bacillus sp. Marseille-Q1617 TaxID=2736887 RepID=UPI00158DEB23|nr:RDD family protein [Bacillus sp. Marseille-Q1617]